MKVIEGFLDLPGASANAGDGSVGTIGNFDGAHLGHQRIFASVRRVAQASGLPPVLITFDPHPLTVLRPEAAPRMILTRSQKIEIFAAEGFDRLYLIPFDRTIAAIEAEAFVAEFLVGRVGIRHLFVGVDFRFGRARRGDLELLRREGTRHGFAVESVETVQHEGTRISASRIREALKAGQVAAAWAMMGRPYEAAGTVVRGAGRGHGQGAPTANLQVENGILPASGVYVTWTRIEGDEAPPTPAPSAVAGNPAGWGAGFPGLTNLGTRPTFDGGAFTVENWLPGFSGDLYGRRLRVKFLERVRDERKFPDPGALREQIGRDLETMRAFFARLR